MEVLSSLNKELINLLKANNLLFPLIKSELIRSKISNVEVPNELREKIIKDCCNANKINNSETELEKLLHNNNTNIDSLIEDTTRDFRLSKYSKEKFEHQVESRFLKNKADLDLAVYSLIRIKDPFKANELYLQIQEGEEEFGSVASKVSEGNERLTRGIVGPININKSHPSLANLIRTAEKGKINKPIQIQEFSLIVRVETLLLAKLDKVMEIKIAKEIFEESVIEEAKGILNGII